MNNLLPNVRQYYAEVGVILETLLGENGRKLVPRILASLSRQSERVQSLVEHEDPFQVALEVGEKTHADWEQLYESFRKRRESADWKKTVEAFDQRYLSEFSNGERRKAVARIVAAHLSHNKIPVSGVSELLETVKTTVDNLNNREKTSTKPNPSISVNRSVTPDYLVCLEDGQKLKTLKAHLLSHHGLTPDEYREKWGLHPDYPMVAPRYSEQRSALAKRTGFGRRTSDQTARRVSRSRA